MAKLMRMPEVAAGGTEAVLAAWARSEGEAFDVLDTIATIETEKAVVDVDAEEAGVLLRILVQPGEAVDVGTPIALLGAPGEQVDVAQVLAELGVIESSDASPAPPAGAAEAVTAVAPPPPAVEPAAAVPVPASAQQAQPAQVPSGERVFSSPLARRLAREAGLEVSAITGTGPGGRILRRDVEAAVAAGGAKSKAAASPAPAPSGTAAPVHPSPTTAAQPGATAGGYTDVPHSRMRRAIARRLSESKQTVPHFYLRGSARVDALLSAREQLNAVSPVRISVNDLVIKAIAWTHVLVPEANVTWHDEFVRQYESVDIAMAVATEKGLVTPVLRGVERMTVGQVAAITKDFASRARAGQLRQDELEGGSVSISNLGMFGTEEFAAIINPPQSAILAVGAVRQEAVVVDGAVVPASVMRVTLSVDHRSVDGALGAKWLGTLIELLENPVRILA